MTSTAERPHSLSEKLVMLDLNLESVPPFNEEDKYGGFFVVTGQGGKAVEFLRVLAEAGGYYKTGYALQSMTRQITNEFESPGYSQIDIWFRNQDGQSRMVRAQKTSGPNTKGEVKIEFGGGSNQTTFVEVEFGLNKAADFSLAKTG